MDINNLTSVYNQNPTLQGQYTLQQYLDLFGGSTYTPPTTPTPTPDVPDQGIINQNINQYQNYDNDRGTGGIGKLTLNAPITNAGTRINSPAFQDPLNEKIANQMRTQNPNLEGRTNAEIISSNPDMFDIKTDRGFFQNTMDNVGNFVRGIESLVSKVPTPGKILGKALGISKPKLSKEDVAFNKSGDMYSNSMGNKFNKYGIAKVSGFGNYSAYVDKKVDSLEEAYNNAVKKLKAKGFTPDEIAKRTKLLREKNEYYKNEQKRKQDAIKAKAELAAAASRRESARQYDPNVHGANNYGLGSDGKQSYDSGQGFGTNATSGGPVSNKTGKGRTDYMYGGSVRKYFKGGIVSLRGR